MGIYRPYLGYEDIKGRVWRHRKPDGWPIDSKCPDGFTCDGYRKVDRQARIRFAGSWWTHETYQPGMIFFVTLADPLGGEINTAQVDPKWNPDTIGDDTSEFINHSMRVLDRIQPEALGGWNARKPK